MKTPVQEANSLEKLLISTGDYLKENREKCLQTLLLILVAVAAVVFLRTYFYGKPKKFQQDFDQAYAISSQQAMLTGLPSVEPYDTLAAHYNRGDAGAEIRINAAEAVLKTGQNQVERKKAASRAGRAAADVIAMDPEATFNDAIKRFEEVTSPQMAVDRGLAARALYGLASAWENLAAVTAGDDEVNVKLDTAKGGYQRIRRNAVRRAGEDPSCQGRRAADARILQEKRRRLRGDAGPRRDQTRRVDSAGRFGSA